MPSRSSKPDAHDLARARDQFHAMLERRTREAEWQKFFAENPYIFSMSLPLRLDPTDFVPLARPGRTEPDFVFYPQHTRPVPFYGVIELKRPDTRIFTTTRENVAVLTRDAQTAIEQAHSFARNPGSLIPLERPDKMLFLGNVAYTFVIMGTSQGLTLDLGLEIYNDMMLRQLPGNLRILTYDELLKRFESGLPRKILFLVPDTDSWFEFETVALEVYGNVLSKTRGYANQFVERLAPGITLDMVEIPGGAFVMGSRKDERESYDDERPQRDVTISNFHIGKYPVTQAQWRVVAGWPKVKRDLDADPSHFKGDHRPVEQVSWEDAVEFCARVSARTGQIHRLSSEAEWEYACRAGTTTPFASLFIRTGFDGRTPEKTGH